MTTACSNRNLLCSTAFCSFPSIFDICFIIYSGLFVGSSATFSATADNAAKYFLTLSEYSVMCSCTCSRNEDCIWWFVKKKATTQFILQCAFITEVTETPKNHLWSDFSQYGLLTVTITFLPEIQSSTTINNWSGTLRMDEIYVSSLFSMN